MLEIKSTDHVFGGRLSKIGFRKNTTCSGMQKREVPEVACGEEKCRVFGRPEGAPGGNELFSRAWHKEPEAEEDGETNKKETTNNSRLWKLLIDRWIQK